MPKGRHRKPQPRPIGQPRPANAAGGNGSHIGIGKARGAKQAIYAQPLPVIVCAPPPTFAKGKGKQTSQQSWAAYLASFLGFGGASAKAASTSRQPVSPRITKVTGHWDPISRSVWLHITPIEGTDEETVRGQTAAVRMLWEKGFFGKGTLSRSEPTWRVRKINDAKVLRERERGNTSIFTPEELTAQRRAIRKAAKIERARLAVRAGQQLPDGIVALGGTLTEQDEKAIERAAERELQREDEAGEDGAADLEYGKHIPGLIYLGPNALPMPETVVQMQGMTPADLGAPTEPQVQVSNPAFPAAQGAGDEDDDDFDIKDMERLQLMPYEVLFLAGMLDVLEVVDERGEPLSLPHLYSLLLRSTLLSPPVSLFSTPSYKDLLSLSSQWARPDNPFLLSYVVYHHYRSLGWVVKSGVKFCIDFLLYKKGPAFGHAEFSIIIIPEYEDPADAKSSPFPPHIHGGERDWVWFSTVNRVNTQVFKTPILCYVTIPPLSRTPPASLADPQAFVDGLKEGKTFSVREVAIRRWVPARMRP